MSDENARQDWGFPKDVDCPNCLRNLVVQGHLGEPSPGVPQKRIHHERMKAGTSSPPFTSHCPNCGHYTRFEPADEPK